MNPRGYPAPNRGPDSVDYQAIKRNAFHDQNILVVNINDTSLPWQDRELLKTIGERLYGKRSAKVLNGGKQ